MIINCVDVLIYKTHFHYNARAMKKNISEIPKQLPNAGKMIDQNGDARFLVVLSLRKAEADDLKIDKKTLKIGQPFWLRGADGRFDNKPQIISKDQDPEEIKMWLQYEMIYVPASTIE